jgi:hypothetical protein
MTEVTDLRCVNQQWRRCMLSIRSAMSAVCLARCERSSPGASNEGVAARANCQFLKVFITGDAHGCAVCAVLAHNTNINKKHSDSSYK